MREAIKPKLRFQVFTRDEFTCQYCGRTPEQDDVVLQVDHTISVKDGGTNDIENLITSCFDCNIGKGAKSILKRTKSEADLVEELNLAKERLAQIKALNKKRNSLKKVQEKISHESTKWARDATEDYLSDKLYLEIQKWRNKNSYSEDIARKALEIAYKKIETLDTIQKFIAYLNGIARNISLTPEQQEIILMYNRDVFQYERMYAQTRKMIMDTSDLGVEFHSDVISKVTKTLETHRGETFKVRDGIDSYFPQENFTVYKSGLGIQILVCDTIAMLLENYDSW